MQRCVPQLHSCVSELQPELVPQLEAMSRLGDQHTAESLQPHAKC